MNGSWRMGELVWGGIVPSLNKSAMAIQCTTLRVLYIYMKGSLGSLNG